MKNDKFYDTVKKHCKERQLTLSQVAYNLGISYRSLLTHLHDADSCSVGLIRKLRSMLHITPEEIRKDFDI